MLVCILPIICILMMHHLSLCDNIQKMEEGNFGKSSCILSDKDTDISNKEKLYKTLCQENISCAVYLDDKIDIDRTIRYMVFTDRYVSLPMISGRFFEKEDFNTDNNVAVVGKNVEGVFEKDGTEFININNSEYKVLGKMGYEEDTPFDNYVFVNLLSCENDMLTIYTVDILGNTKEIDVENCIEKFDNQKGKIEILSVTDSFANTVTVEVNTMVYFVGLLGSYILCIILISYQWLICQRRELGIRRLLGASKNQVSFFILRRYVFYLLASFIVGLGYCKYFYPSYEVSFFKGYFVSAGILILFMLVTINRIKKDSIEEVIRS